jgi:hypothetical protein
MERREFLKLTLGFTAAAGALAAAATAAQAVPMLSPDMLPVTPPKAAETAARQTDKAKTESAAQDDLNLNEAGDTDMSSQRRRRRRFWRRRRIFVRRRIWRRRRRVIYY